MSGDISRNFKLRFGEKNPKTKLTEAQVIEIVGHIVAGLPYVKIAKMYGISDVNVASIHRRETWVAVTKNYDMPPRIKTKKPPKEKNRHRAHLKVKPVDYPTIEKLYTEGMSYRNISKVYGCSANTIRNIVHRLDVYTLNNWRIVENAL